MSWAYRPRISLPGASKVAQYFQCLIVRAEEVIFVESFIGGLRTRITSSVVVYTNQPNEVVKVELPEEKANEIGLGRMEVGGMAAAAVPDE